MKNVGFFNFHDELQRRNVISTDEIERRLDKKATQNCDGSVSTQEFR